MKFSSSSAVHILTIIRMIEYSRAGLIDALLLLNCEMRLKKHGCVCVLISFIYNLGLTNKPIKVPHRGYMLALTTKG
jgi:hypothetical protein